MVRHIVMFDFSNLTPVETQNLVDGFERLSSLETVLHFEWGLEKNAEDSPQGFTHCFMLTFENFQKRTEYLNSSEHRSYEREVMKFRKNVLVFDYDLRKVK